MYFLHLFIHFICHHVLSLPLFREIGRPLLMLCFFFLFSQEPPVTSKEKQKSVTTGAAPSNQAV